MLVDGVDPRCIVCLQPADRMTAAHIIPAAVGGRLRVRLECQECNSLLGRSVEAQLKSDPCVRLAIEALRDQVPGLWRRMRTREPFVASAEVTVRATARGEKYHVRDAPQSDGSIIKDPARGRVDIATRLRRAGSSDDAITDALAALDNAPEGKVVHLGAGLAARRGSVCTFDPDLGVAPHTPEECPLAIAYRFLALVLGRTIYDSALQPIREALTGSRKAARYHVRPLVARRDYAALHGLAVVSVAPHLVVHIRLFGQIAWDVHFTGISLRPDSALPAYQVDLARGLEEAGFLSSPSEHVQG